jgi:hypothetical protein
MKTIECHFPGCTDSFQWDNKPSQIFVTDEVLRKRRWILFQGLPYCLPCAVQAMANALSEALNRLRM